jgi:hypothetical protein
MNLFRSAKHETRWFAFVGWVSFPAEVNGWQKRQPARDIDPLDVREVPLRLGFNTGLPCSDVTADSTSGLRVRVVARHLKLFGNTLAK